MVGIVNLDLSDLDLCFVTMATETITSVVVPLDNRAREVSVGQIVVLEGTELVVKTTVLGGVEEVVQLLVTVLGL